MIHSVKSILLFNFANSLLPLIKDFAGLSTEDDRISCSGDLWDHNEGKTHAWAVKNILKEYGGGGIAIGELNV